MSDSESDRACCKGVRRTPCDSCGRYICPTSGHGEGETKFGSWLCTICITKYTVMVLKIKYRLLVRAYYENRVLTRKEIKVFDKFDDEQERFTIRDIKEFADY